MTNWNLVASIAIPALCSLRVFFLLSLNDISSLNSKRDTGCLTRLISSWLVFRIKSSLIVSETCQSLRMSVIGVPVKVLHEAEGHIVTIETTSGEVDLFVLII